MLNKEINESALLFLPFSSELREDIQKNWETV